MGFKTCFEKLSAKESQGFWRRRAAGGKNDNDICDSFTKQEKTRKPSPVAIGVSSNQLGVKLAVGWSRPNFFQYQKTTKGKKKNVMTITVFIPKPTKLIFFLLQATDVSLDYISALHDSKCSHPNRADTPVRYLRKEVTARTASDSNKSLPLAICPPGWSMQNGKPVPFSQTYLFISNSVSTTQIYYSSSPSVESRRSFLSKVKRNENIRWKF